jgi:hypothetical protein
LIQEEAVKGTSSGRTFQRAVAAVLKSNHIVYQEERVVGTQLTGSSYKADLILPGSGTIISCKWQAVGGTAEQKLLYEVASLIKCIRESAGRYRRAFVVYGGKGFSPGMLTFLEQQRHQGYLVGGVLVQFVTFDELSDLANRDLDEDREP